MSEDNQRDREYNEQKKKRRTRKDEEGRNFTCPCGKSYLSYPALYTHIKTKHHGKAPKQENYAAKPDPVEQNQTGDPLCHLKGELQKYFPNNNEEVYLEKLQDANKQYISKIIEHWESVKSAKPEDPANHLNENINNIFARFLCEMKSKIKAEGYSYLQQLIYLFHCYIVQLKKQNEYCEQNNGIQLPHFFNELIIKKTVPKPSGSQTATVKDLTTACKVLYYFGIWLFDQRFTNFSVKFNVVN